MVFTYLSKIGRATMILLLRVSSLASSLNDSVSSISKPSNALGNIDIIVRI